MKKTALFLFATAFLLNSNLSAQNRDSILQQARAQYKQTTSDIFSPFKSVEVVPTFQLGYLMEKQQYDQFVNTYFENQSTGVEFDEEKQVLSDNIPDKDARVPTRKFRFFELPIILQSGDRVKLEFGRSADMVSANQEVSSKLVQALREVLEEANAALLRDSIPPIRRLYISASTNGKHSPTSNHSRKEAIDISEVNGQRMIYNHFSSQQREKLKELLASLDYRSQLRDSDYIRVEGQPYALDEIFLSDRIQYLQAAMLNHPYTRENFGPFLKTKYAKETGKLNPNHPVGGHQDHIHWSVR